MIKKPNQILNRPFIPRVTFVLGRGISVGVVTGIIVSIFRWILDQAMKCVYHIYPQMATHHILLIPYIILMILICIILGKIISPYIKNLAGSGISQVEAMFEGENYMPWWEILWRKFVGGILASAPGLMLAREGPCIQMGTMVGQGLAEDLYKSDKKELRRLQQSGIAAGLSAAFSAPMASVFFLIEVITHELKPIDALSALVASFSADLVTVIFFGTKPCLYLPVKNDLPLHAYWALPLIGIILGIFAYIYQYCLLSLRPLFSKITIIPRQYHSIIPLILIIPVGLWNAKLLGGSHLLISSLFKHEVLTDLSKGSTTLILIAIGIFFIRFIYSMLSYGASVPGGTFMPILVLGALLGVIFANVLVHNNVISTTYYPHIIIISMAAYFGAIAKAPFTAVILLTEMVGTVEQVLPMILTTFIAYYILDLLGGRSLYDEQRVQMDFKHHPTD